MSSFKEIAEMARINEPTQKLGSINYCMLIAELAEELDRRQVNKDKLRKLRAHYAQLVKNFADEQNQANVWPMIIGIGATLDVVLQELDRPDD
jgi:hypothetical protein